jgi:hypothetical protein
MTWRNIGGPSLTDFGLVIHGFARNRRNPDEMLAGRTLNFPAGKLLFALQMLLAMRAGELVRVHGFFVMVITPWCANFF